jgi:hypothetical protein
MGYPATSKTQQLAGKESDHTIIDPSAGMKVDSAELRFSALATQIRDGAYPLHMAVQQHAPTEVIEMLLKGACGDEVQTNKFGDTPLNVALKAGADDGTVEILLVNNPDAVYMRERTSGNLPLHTVAMYGGSVHVTKDILEVWPEAIHEINQEGLTPKALAARHGKCSDEVLSLLDISEFES